MHKRLHGRVGARKEDAVTAVAPVVKFSLLPACVGLLPHAATHTQAQYAILQDGGIPRNTSTVLVDDCC
jgi:hypothetical protein